ncbi:hypothetical protein BO86DRAFT_437671 [Aspergillus japonicus CBS 114.51]|uniref:Uncharacterized protein n=1 Tax=Aspergillus japonicus CBS 114.51 TaxID=1448312 RepID=A0A8T8WSE2_ASPJA|nr:hypothetical protein BO86DRAFT_437671 [Aspergillus japonicus CBS 114.51]RAH78765.1 hypothetical protein BO86DRAFT_437671 [Aspergillus japonicus CBS 114.51]
MPTTPIPRQLTNLTKKPPSLNPGLPSPSITGLPARKLPQQSTQVSSPKKTRLFSNFPARGKNNSPSKAIQHGSLNPPKGQNGNPTPKAREDANSKVPIPLLVPLQALLRDAATLALILDDMSSPQLILVVVDGLEALHARAQMEGTQRWTVDPAYRDRGRAMIVDRGCSRTHWTAGERLFDAEVYEVIERAVEYATTGGTGGDGSGGGRGFEMRMRGFKFG